MIGAFVIAVQGLGILAGGAMAQLVGAPARHELDAPARPANPGTAERAGES